MAVNSRIHVCSYYILFESFVINFYKHPFYVQKYKMSVENGKNSKYSVDYAVLR